MSTQSTAPGLTPEQFRTISAIAHSEAGLVLVESKASMISARLAKRVRSLRLSGLDAYFELLKSPNAREEMPNLLSALTTNVSHFFREEHHFDTLRKEIVPELRRRAQAGERVRIWSAGCSNGQELYSVAMTISEEFPEFSRYDIKLLGTDIDPSVVSTATAGIYDSTQIKGLSEKRLKDHFQQTDNHSGYQVAQSLRNAVTFRVLNLIEDWPMRHPFDAVFCRNVVIYFDEKTQMSLWPRLTKAMKSDGWLFVGHSERVQDPESCKLKTAGITTYRRSESALKTTTDRQDGQKWH